MGLHLDFGKNLLETEPGLMFPVLCLAVSEIKYVSDIELLILLASKHPTIPVA